MSLFDRGPDSRFVVASARSVVGVGHDFEDDVISVRKCPDIQGDRCYGLFAKRDIDDEVPIGEYIGKVLNRQHSLGLCDCKRVYLFQITNNRYIDASDPLQSSVIRYINHPRDGEGPNATFVKSPVKGLGVRWRIYAVTLRKIMAGEQLLCMYDETPGDHDQIPAMTRSEVRTALRKRTSEVAQLREELVDSRADLEEHPGHRSVLEEAVHEDRFLCSPRRAEEVSERDEEARRQAGTAWCTGSTKGHRINSCRISAQLRLLFRLRRHRLKALLPDRMSIGHQCKIPDAS